MSKTFETIEPTRDAIDSLSDPTVLEFGTGWCGYCQGAQPLIEQAFSKHSGIAHIKIEDGPGRPLGRSFRIKQWPTLIFLKGGQEVARLVRPQSVEEITEAMTQIER